MTSRQQLVSRGVSCALAFSSSAFAADTPWDGNDGNDWNKRDNPGVNGEPVKAGFADPAVVGVLPNIAVIDGTISTELRENFDGKVAGGRGLPGMAGGCEAPGVWLPDYNDTAPGFNGGGDLQTPAEDHGYITLTAVPEPAAALIGSLGLLALVRRRRG
jgi:hypothetical protein